VCSPARGDLVAVGGVWAADSGPAVIQARRSTSAQGRHRPAGMAQAPETRHSTLPRLYGSALSADARRRLTAIAENRPRPGRAVLIIWTPGVGKSTGRGYAKASGRYPGGAFFVSFGSRRHRSGQVARPPSASRAAESLEINAGARTPGDPPLVHLRPLLLPWRDHLSPTGSRQQLQVSCASPRHSMVKLVRRLDRLRLDRWTKTTRGLASSESDPR
jgi:hypothetical protein